MTESNPRLGRGLSALLGGAVDRAAISPTDSSPAPDAPSDTKEAKAVPESGLTLLPIGTISPNPAQPRRRFDEGGLEALAASIAESGLLQPVVVSPRDDGTYQLIAGERRWQAAQRAGVTHLPAVVRDADSGDRLELALVENVVREDLNPMEVARGVAALVEDFGRTHESVARTLGRSRPAVSNLLRLLELPDDIADMVETGELSEGHARAVLMADGARARRALAAEIVAEGLSVRAAEQRARAAAKPRRTASTDVAEPSPVIDEATDRLYGVFGVPARITTSRRGLRVEMMFPDDTALQAALDRLAAGTDVSRETE